MISQAEVNAVLRTDATAFMERTFVQFEWRDGLSAELAH